jgi:hypothetical protein
LQGIGTGGLEACQSEKGEFNDESRNEPQNTSARFFGNEIWIENPSHLLTLYGEDRYEPVQKLAYEHWENGLSAQFLKLIGLRRKHRARTPVGFES